MNEHDKFDTMDFRKDIIRATSENIKSETAKQIFKELEACMPEGLDGRCISKIDFYLLKKRWIK